MPNAPSDGGRIHLRDVALGDERTSERLHHLVVEGAAVERVRMGDQRQAARLLGHPDDDFEVAGSAG